MASTHEGNQKINEKHEPTAGEPHKKTVRVGENGRRGLLRGLLKTKSGRPVAKGAGGGIVGEVAWPGGVEGVAGSEEGAALQQLASWPARTLLGPAAVALASDRALQNAGKADAERLVRIVSRLLPSAKQPGSAPMPSLLVSLRGKDARARIVACGGLL